MSGGERGRCPKVGGVLRKFRNNRVSEFRSRHRCECPNRNRRPGVTAYCRSVPGGNRHRAKIQRTRRWRFCRQGYRRKSVSDTSVRVIALSRGICTSIDINVNNKIVLNSWCSQQACRDADAGQRVAQRPSNATSSECSSGLGRLRNCCPKRNIACPA